MEPTHHHIQSEARLSTATVIAPNGFLASYLVQRLIQLPINVVVVSGKEIEELKHLDTHTRFKRFTITDPNDARTLPAFEYALQVVDSQLLEEGDELHLARTILKHAAETPVKYELVRNITTREVARDMKPEGTTIEHLSQRQGGQDEFLTDVIEEARKRNLNLRILNILHVYGPRMALEAHGQLPALLRQTHEGRGFVVEGEGLAPLYPVFADDVADAAVKAIFSESTAGQAYCVGGREEITTINFAYKLREMFLRRTKQLRDVRFLESRTSSETISDRAMIRRALSNTRESLGWQPKTELDDGLSTTWGWMDARSSLLHETPEATGEIDRKAESPMETETIRRQAIDGSDKDRGREKSVRSGSVRRWWKTAILLLLLMVLVPPAAIAMNTVAASLMLVKATQDLKGYRLQGASVSAQRSRSLFEAGERQLVLFSGIPIQPIKNVMNHAQYLNRMGKLTASAINQAASTAIQAEKIKAALLTTSQNTLQDEVTTASEEIEALHRTLARIKALIAQDSFSRAIAQKIAVRTGADLEKLDTLRTLMSDVRKILELLPIFAGADGRHTYLVLLQNNAELRPTGGFIGSFAEITFEKGRLLEWKVEDVYAVDGQLKGHVEPPWEIKRFLGEAGWYLRDGNWDPDFPSAARQIEWFYEKETGKSVDGTIALNLYVLEDILRALGPIRLPDYNVTVTAESLSEYAQFQSEMSFFPGSTQKKDFLTSVARHLMFKLESAGQAELIRLGAALVRALEQRQLLVAVHDPRLQQVMHDSRWDGSLRESACPDKRGDCVATSLAVREANLGVNKANYYISRAIRVWENLSEEKPETQILVAWQNASPVNAWPGGEYKVYVRIYTDLEKQLTRATIDGDEIQADRIAMSSQHGRRVIGVLVNVPEGEESQLELVLSGQPPSSAGDRVVASLLIQKQPGTREDPLTLTIGIPRGMQITNTSHPFTIKDGIATRSQALREDLSLLVEMQQGR